MICSSLPHKGHLTVSDVCQNVVWVVTTGGREEATARLWWVEGMVTAKHPTVNTLAPLLSAPTRANGGQVEKH